VNNSEGNQWFPSETSFPLGEPCSLCGMEVRGGLVVIGLGGLGGAAWRDDGVQFMVASVAQNTLDT
jgi:hypothetical protein